MLRKHPGGAEHVLTEVDIQWLGTLFPSSPNAGGQERRDRLKVRHADGGSHDAGLRNRLGDSILLIGSECPEVVDGQLAGFLRVGVQQPQGIAASVVQVIHEGLADIHEDRLEAGFSKKLAHESPADVPGPELDGESVAAFLHGSTGTSVTYMPRPPTQRPDYTTAGLDTFAEFSHRSYRLPVLFLFLLVFRGRLCTMSLIVGDAVSVVCAVRTVLNKSAFPIIRSDRR